MLTLDSLRRIRGLEQTLGISFSGACFGVSDPSQLRQITPKSRVILGDEALPHKKSASKIKPNKKSA